MAGKRTQTRRRAKSPAPARTPDPDQASPAIRTGPPLEFTVRGRPVPQGSMTAFAFTNKATGKVRAVVAQGGSKARRSALAEWRSAIADAALVALGVRSGELAAVRFAGVGLTVELEFRIPRPDSHFGTGRNADKLKPSAPAHPIGKSKTDLDKLARAALDALTGIAYDDDSRVVELVTRKVYADGARPEGLRVRIVKAREAVEAEVEAAPTPGPVDGRGIALERAGVVAEVTPAELLVILGDSELEVADWPTPPPASKASAQQARIRQAITGSKFAAEARAFGHATTRHLPPTGQEELVVDRDRFLGLATSTSEDDELEVRPEIAAGLVERDPDLRRAVDALGCDGENAPASVDEDDFGGRDA